jgi:hypothetical protein
MEFEVNLNTGLIGCEEKECLESSPLSEYVRIKRRKYYNEWYADMKERVMSLEIEDLTKLSEHFTVRIERGRYVCIRQLDFH